MVGKPYLFSEITTLKDALNDHPDWVRLSRAKLYKEIKRADLKISTKEIDEHISRKREKAPCVPREVFTVRFEKITLFD